MKNEPSNRPLTLASANHLTILPLSVKDLVEQIKRAVREELATTEDKAAQEEQLLSRKEASSFLKISLPTLAVYTKEGVLHAYRLGRRRIYYRRSELISSLALLRYATLDETPITNP